MASSSVGLCFLRGLVGAAIGGLLGYFAFFWIASQGFYALVLPGASLGIGFGILHRGQTTAGGVLCAILAILLGLYSDWKLRPFIKDDSLLFFLTHVHQLTPIILIMIGVGGCCGYWFGKGTGGRIEKEQSVIDDRPD